MTHIPETGLLRIKQIIGDPKANPPIPGIIPVSKSTWWKGCREGHFPKPIKIGTRTTVWRAEDIRQFTERLGQRSQAPIKGQIKTQKTERDLIDRVAAFDDSKELAAKLNAIGDEHKHKGNSYWPKEAATHIDGLFALATDLSRALERALNSKQ